MARVEIHPVADWDDGIEFVILDLAYHLSLALALNCCIFCNCCPTLQLVAGKNVAQVARDHRLVLPEQVGQLLQAQPNILLLDAHFDAGVTAFINDDFRFRPHSPRSLRKASAFLMRSSPEIILGRRVSLS